MTGHPPKFLDEVSSVVGVIVHIPPKQVVGLSKSPFPVIFLEAIDPRQASGRETHMLLKEDFQIAPGESRALLKLLDGDDTVR
jgi:hypothetical protein